MITRLIYIVTISLWVVQLGNSQEEDVDFISGGYMIEGTLTMPSNSVGKVPIAILVHGSGPNDRDQTIVLAGANSLCLYPNLYNQTIRNFKDISDYLSKEGIAVLRYDKRTYTHGAILDPKEITVNDFVDDIISAVDYIKSRNELDEEQIFILGHSQGSTLIGKAGLHRNIMGLISLSGPTTGIDTIFTEQLRRLYIKCANDPNTGEFVANQLYEQYDKIRAGAFNLDNQVKIELPGGQGTLNLGYGKFWKSWINLSDSTIRNYENSSSKILALQGNEDFNVPYENVYGFLQVRGSVVKLYDNMNHFLTPTDNARVDEELLQDLVNWIKECKLTSSTIDRSLKLNVIPRGNSISISSNQTIGIVEVYNLKGQKEYHIEVQGNSIDISLEGNEGIKLLRIMNSSGMKIYKIWLH